MRKNLCIIILALITFSCADKPADNNKEKNKVEAVKKNIKEIQIVLNSNDLMQYDKKVLSASPGQEITLTLNHTGRIKKTMMGHNFVLLKKGVDVDDFARRAIEARDTEFIPEGDETIAYTKLIGGGESVTITFDAPQQGIYNFICSFPAHYQLMRGQLIF